VYRKDRKEQVLKVARASYSPAPGITATVAPFRAWRNSRLTVAGKPTRAGRDYRRFHVTTQSKSAIYL